MTFLLSTWLQAMKRKPATGARNRRGANRPHRVTLRLEVLEDRRVPSTLTVTNNLDTGVAGDGSLRGEIAAAASGDTIHFDPSLAGQTITLTSGELAINQNMDIEGLGSDQLTISGNNASRVFDISGSAKATIAGLTMTDGLVNGSSPVLASSGGAILNFGNLTISNDVLSNNQAIGDAGKSPTGKPGCALGGALANLGTATVNISSSDFIGNLALGADGSSGPSAGDALGGALLNGLTGFATATITDCVFSANVAQAGSHESGNIDATAAGGAVNSSSALTVSGSTFSHNLAIGGNDSTGTVRPGLAVAGALVSGGPAGVAATLVVSDSTFDHSQAIGGNRNQSSSNPAPSILGPNDAASGGIGVSGGTATISGCTIEHNSAIAGAGADGQNGGLAWGGGMQLFNAFGHGTIATVSNCTIAYNAAIAGAGGSGADGGYAWGGGLAILLGSALTVSSSTVDHNRAIGGAGGSGGNGGDGLGGGIYEDAVSTLTLMGVTVEYDLALGGAACLGGSDGEGVGGGIYVTSGGLACADLLTVIAKNHASTSNDDVFGALGQC
jgi:hypothetical protein